MPTHLSALGLTGKGRPQESPPLAGSVCPAGLLWIEILRNRNRIGSKNEQSRFSSDGGLTRLMHLKLGPFQRVFIGLANDFDIHEPLNMHGTSQSHRSVALNREVTHLASIGLRTETCK